MAEITIHCGDVLDVLPTLSAGSVSCIVTSPPYFRLRDYGVPSSDWPEITYRPMEWCPEMQCCLGHEDSPEAFVAHLVYVFRLLHRVLHRTGTAWLNLGDCYATNPGNGRGRGERATLGNGGGAPHRSGQNRSGHSLKRNNLLLIPHAVAMALRADGWRLRSDIVWAKAVSMCPTYSGSVMPESARNRPTMAHEALFLLAKSPRYFYDDFAVREIAAVADNADDHQRGTAETPSPFRNLRNVWTINPQPLRLRHHSTFPEALVEPCIRASTSERGVCPSCGAPWLRVVHVPKVPDEVFTARSAPQDGLIRSGSTRNGKLRGHGQKLQDWRNAHPPETVDWRPGCDCGSNEPVPATVLDPFGGAGTTALVAHRLRRDTLAIEINPQSAHAAARRVACRFGTLFDPIHVTNFEATHARKNKTHLLDADADGKVSRAEAQAESRKYHGETSNESKKREKLGD